MTLLLGTGAVLLAWALSSAQIFLTIRLARYVRRAPVPLPLGHSLGKVAVVLPCKGIDPGFNENIRALLAQDYPDVVYWFVTKEREDPAALRLKILLAAFPEKSTHLIVSRPAPQRAEKISNQLAALAEIGNQADILAFVDSDVRPASDFLRRLVAPLEEPGVGVATGFRWYQPVQGGLGSNLRAVWNAGGIPFLADPSNNYAWGGAMAIRREVFESCEVARAWEGALSDDFGLTNSVKAAGLSVRFVPHCLVVSHEDATLTEAVEWTNRQTRITRVYAPRFWRTVGVVHGLFIAITLAGTVLVFGALVSGWGVGTMLLGAGLLSTYGFTWLNGVLLVRVIQPLLGPKERKAFNQKAVCYIFLGPLAAVLAFWNTLHSLGGRTITWRGITYEMVSPTKTRIRFR